MPDLLDLVQEQEYEHRADAIRDAAKPLAPGIEGDCDLCGEWSGRLINGACAPCRDLYKLP